MPAKTEHGGIYNPPINNNHTYKQSLMMMIHDSDIIVSIDRNSKLDIIKHRYGNTKKRDISLDCAIELFAQMLSKAAFHGKMDMFQSGMKIQLIRSMTEIIKEGGIL